MRAVVCRAHGHYRDMAVEDLPPPPLQPGHVRIAVHAAGVSFANTLAVAGRHQNRAEPPFIPGTEVGGVVIETAADVTRCRPGDRVAAGLTRGGFADEAVARAVNVYPIPDTLSFADATHFPTLYGTAYGALAWRARLRAGETLLVHGAAGGSGLSAVEVGKALGATVIATAGSDEKLAVVAEHGADHCINYRNEDIRARVLEITGGRGADLVYDPVGGDVFDASLRCIAPEGRIVAIGFAAGRIPQVPANILLVKNITVTGFYWGYYLGWGKTQAEPAVQERVGTVMAEMFGWYEAGKLRPVTCRTFDLADFAAALDMVVERKVVGKVVLTTGR